MKISLFIIIFSFLSCQSFETSQDFESPLSKKTVEDLHAQELKDEVTIGKEMAAKLCGTYGVWEKSKTTESYIRTLGTYLVTKVGRPELTYTFGILDTPEINAYATPGGYIFVTRGLLKHIESENELAVILAHEIAHVNLKHMFKDIAPKREVSSHENIMRVFSKGKSEVAIAFSKAINQGLNNLISVGINPEKEFEADLVGAEYAAAVGYDFTEYISLLDRLDQLKSNQAQVAKTHPPFSLRRDKLLHYKRSQENILLQSLESNYATKNRFLSLLNKKDLD